MVIIFAVGSGVILWDSKVPSPTPKTQAELDAAALNTGNPVFNWFAEDEEGEMEESVESGEVVNMASVPTTNTNTNTTPTPSTSTTSPNSDQPAYLFAEVQTHNTPSDCWSVVNGNVYDLTSWVSKHPGGAAPIRGMCGTDGTAGYTGQHGNSKKIQATLILFKIGVLKQ